MGKKLNEKRVTFEERVEALAEFLGLDDGEKEEITKGYTDGYLEYGKEEYRVLTDDEADEAFNESQSELWDDLGIECYAKHFQEWILENCVEESWFEDAMEESNRAYAEDIMDERDRTYGTRLVEECYDNGLIDDDDFEEDEDGDPDYEQCKKDEDELVELMTEYLNDQYDDPVQWFKDNFGLDDLSEVAKENNLIDTDRVFEEVKDSDGRGPTLASYDGDENEVKVKGDWFYIYRTN